MTSLSPCQSPSSAPVGARAAAAGAPAPATGASGTNGDDAVLSGSSPSTTPDAFDEALPGYSPLLGGGCCAPQLTPPAPPPCEPPVSCEPPPSCEPAPSGAPAECCPPTPACEASEPERCEAAARHPLPASGRPPFPIVRSPDAGPLQGSGCGQGPIFLPPDLAPAPAPAPAAPAASSAPTSKPGGKDPVSPSTDLMQVGIHLPTIFKVGATVLGQAARVAGVGQTLADSTEPIWIRWVNDQKVINLASHPPMGANGGKIAAAGLKGLREHGTLKYAAAYMADEAGQLTFAQKGMQTAVKGGAKALPWLARGVNVWSTFTSVMSLRSVLKDKNATDANKIAHALHVATSAVGIGIPGVGLFGDALMLAADGSGLLADNTPAPASDPGAAQAAKAAAKSAADAAASAKAAAASAAEAARARECPGSVDWCSFGPTTANAAASTAPSTSTQAS